MLSFKYSFIFKRQVAMAISSSESLAFLNGLVYKISPFPVIFKSEKPSRLSSAPKQLRLISKEYIIP